jgi:hypothetical protein
MVKARVEHIKECGTGTEPDSSDLNLAIDVWILVCNEKDSIKAAKKKSSDEIEADAKALQVDQDNMKRSYRQKRNRDGSSSDGYSDISDVDDDLPATPLVAITSKATTSETSQDTISTPPACSPSTPLSSRKHIKSLKKSGLRYEIEPLFDALKGSLAILAGADKEKENKATDERLTKIEARIEEGQVELKSISNKMLALLEAIAQKQ